MKGQRVAIHASARLDPEEYDAASDLIEFHSLGFTLEPANRCPLGAIVGTVEVVDCVTESESPWFVGEFGFVLRRPIAPLCPIRVKGALGFWQVTPAIEAEIRGQELRATSLQRYAEDVLGYPKIGSGN